jgi:7-cyano-7-deazaguanine synthase
MNGVILLSGGMDSSTLLAHTIDAFPDGRHTCISFDYGQRHSRELHAANDISHYYNTPHQIANLRQVGKEFMFGSSQTSGMQVPHGHYTDASMKVTVVPNRNMVMLSIATAFAIATKSDFVGYAAHAGDHAIYPDCRPEFVTAMGEAIRLCDEHKVSIYTPFIDSTKAQILEEGLYRNVPYELTWTCYEGGEHPCQKCGTCVERAEAFAINKHGDPLLQGKGKGA